MYLRVFGLILVNSKTKIYSALFDISYRNISFHNIFLIWSQIFFTNTSENIFQNIFFRVHFIMISDFEKKLFLLVHIFLVNLNHPCSYIEE